MAALYEESEEQQRQLGLIKGCRIKTSPGKGERNVVVGIFPGIPPQGQKADARDYDFDNKKLGESYAINAPELFPNDEETMKKHKIFGKAITSDWEISIIKNVEGYEAPLVGIIRNSFDDISLFLGVEENVSLEPIFIDVQGERSRSTVRRFRDTVNEFEAQAKGYLADPRYPPQIPAVDLFSMKPCDQKNNELAPAPTLKLTKELKEKLNESQVAAMSSLLRNKISIIWGAPGTGKSQVLTEALMYLGKLGEKIVACGIANVAVDALYRKCVAAYRKLGLKGDIPFVRLYSESQIMGQYAAGDFVTLDDPNHIESLRYKLAKQNQDRFAAWLKARDELRRFGSLNNEKVYEDYSRQNHTLSQRILDHDARVVFCTIAACQSNAMYRTSRETGEISWAFPATSIFLDESGTATRPLMLIPAMTFVKTAKRFVLAGDPYQLPPLLLSAYAKREWPKSMLLSLIQLNWPCSFLNTQYRMSEALYEHLCAVIYSGKNMTIKHFKKMGSPSQYGRQLFLAMPIQFQAGQEFYQLTSYMNFIDAANGTQETIPGGSSWNVEEIDIIDALIVALKKKGVLPGTIAVCTGYTQQRKLLMARAKQNGWSDMGVIMTIDSSQGEEFPIVIISLVTTRGQPGFMGTLNRANVATSRQKEALYFVGNAAYWFTRQDGGSKIMHNILKHINGRSSAWNRSAFIQKGLSGTTYVP